jgi:hypothetical protein
MGRTRTSRDILETMQQVKDLDSCLEALPALLDAVEALAEEHEISVDRINHIAGCLAEIRSLLQEIDRYAGPRIETLSVPRIGKRFRDLEGWLKELRNDRLPVRRRHGACS